MNNENLKKEIDGMSQTKMARIWRFHALDSKFFSNDNQEIAYYFAKKFKEKGGMTPQISKLIGWEQDR